MSNLYQLSGFPLLAVAEDRTPTRLKHHFQIIPGSGFPIELQGQTNGIPVCKASDIANSNGVIKCAENYLQKETVYKSGFKIIPCGSIVFPKIGEAMKKNNRAFTMRDCCVDNNCQGIVPFNIEPRFAYYLSTMIDMQWFDNGGPIPCVNNSKLKDCYLPIPSSNVQSRIAVFLDERCAKIDEAIARHQALISKLDEYRKAIITKAVTKGIDGNSVFDRVPIKHIVRYNLESLPESTPKDFEFDYIDISSVSYEKGVETMERMKFDNAPSRARRTVKPNDVIISTVRTYLKAVAQIPVFNTPLIVSTGFIVMTAIESRITPSYLGYAVKSERFINDVQVGSYGISYPAIKASELVNIKIDLPTIAEQQEIVALLDEKCAAIDSAKDRHTQLISKLEEYKKSLIYNAVTGKIEC